MENGECDEDCNLLACRYDNGDCDGHENNPKDYKNSRADELFYPSIDFTNILLETKLKLHNRNCSISGTLPYCSLSHKLCEITSYWLKNYR